MEIFDGGFQIRQGADLINVASATTHHGTHGDWEVLGASPTRSHQRTFDRFLSDVTVGVHMMKRNSRRYVFFYFDIVTPITATGNQIGCPASN